ncbi:MAG: hypothetical protein R2800_05530 [Flavipsychrobacter sp.]
MIKKAAVLLLVLTSLGFGVDYYTAQGRLPNVFTLVPFLLLIVVCLIWLVMYVFRFIVDNSKS